MGGLLAEQNELCMLSSTLAIINVFHKIWDNNNAGDPVSDLRSVEILQYLKRHKQALKRLIYAQ